MISETEKRRMRALQRRLLPAGTRLKDAPPDWRGLTWQEWEELQWLEWRASIPESDGQQKPEGKSS